MYNLYKININNEKLLKESLSNTPRPIKELLKELTSFIITSNLLITIKKEYENDNII